MKNRYKTYLAFLLLPLSTSILFGLCQLAARSKDESLRTYYLDLAERFRQWIIPPGSRRVMKLELDGALQLHIKANICEFVGFQLCAGIAFEPYEMNVMRRLVKRGDIVFDVGANIGIYSLVASHLVGDGRVYAFEPASFAYKLLLDNLRLNNTKNVTAVRSVVNEQLGEVELYINSESVLNSMGLTNRGKIVSIEKVPCVTLDAFASDNKISKIDFLKIDVEGFEGHVLRGAKNLIRNSPELVILCELAEKNYRPLNLCLNDVMDWIRELGLEIWEIEKTSGAITCIKLNRPRYDNHNFIFIRRASKKSSFLHEALAR